MADSFDPRPTTWLGLSGFVVGSVGVIVAVRILLGRTLVNGTDPITIVGILGGVVAGMAMVLVLEWRATVDDDDRPVLRVLQWLHVTYLTVAGGLYPAVMGDVMGLSRQWYAALPGAVLTAVVWSEFLFILAAITYLVAGVLRPTVELLDVWLDLFWFYLVYGIVFGGIVGASEAVWLPLVPGSPLG